MASAGPPPPQAASTEGRAAETRPDDGTDSLPAHPQDAADQARDADSLPAHPQDAADQARDDQDRDAAGPPGRLGRWLGMAPEADSVEAKTEFGVMAGFACGAAAAIKAPELFGLSMEHDGEVYARNLGLLVLPMLAGYFAWSRHLPRRTLALLAAGFVALAVAVNIYPFERGDHGADTEILAALHLPILLWLAVGVAHTGGRWRSHDRRMDFVRFTGEWCIYYGLIALGGGIFAGSTAAIFSAIGLDAGEFVGLWLVPCGAAGATVVAAWLAERRQGVLERIAPVLTRLFTPLFTALLVVFLLAMALTGRGIDVGRDVLISFDVLLALVLGMVIYSVAARDRGDPRGVFDLMQLLLVVAALLVDLLVLGAIVGRLSDFGATPNRIAALGENLVLLANLAWSAWLYLGFWRGRHPFAALERWQTAYAPVYAAWTAAVVVAFPPAFGFS